jgi:hypothetical protein
MSDKAVKSPATKNQPEAVGFGVLSSFRFVVFSGRKDDNYRFGVLSSFRKASKRRQDDKTPSEKTTN